MQCLTWTRPSRASSKYWRAEAMTSKREKTAPMRMRKIILVICEGETEESYVNLLKRWYKLPIRIVSRVAGTRVSPSFVEKRTNELKISREDDVQAYLMYDMDVEAINEKLRSCKAGLLLSNPCFELWLLLHAKDQRSAVSSDEVIKALRDSNPVWQRYAKSVFTDKQKDFLKEYTPIAIDRAMHLAEFDNPSSGVYKLIRKLENEHR